MDTLSTHYAQLLGLDDSWRVDAVELRLDERRVEVRLDYVGTRVSCPECGVSCGLADHAEERRWRHLDTMQFTTELVARLPRCRCPDHGVKTIVPPWAGKHSRFTLFFEAFAIEVLQACRTVKAAASLLGLSWDAAQTIMDRAVERGLERREAKPVPHLGIDEKNFGKGQDYITVLTDLDGSRVLDVAPERTQAAAEAVLQTLSVEQRQEVQAVAADMLPAYANAVANQTPNAELVHDKFHVAKHLGEAVDQVRRAENKALQAEDDDRLKGPRQLWLFNQANLSPAQRRRFVAIRQSGLKTARAWAIKEEFRWFWRHVYAMSADEFFSQWYAWGVRCRLRPIVKVARMLKRHLPNLLSYFRHRITNAMSEGFNSVIQALKYAARGFRSFQNYRTRILFFCGKIDLRPRLPCH
jgi:transposase